MNRFLLQRIAIISLLSGSVSPLCAQTAQTAPVPEKPIERDFVKVTGFRYGPWRSSVIGGGGYIQNVVPCPSNAKRFYTYVDVGGLSRSDDGGTTWRMLHGNLPATLASYEVRGLIVDPRDDRKIVVAIGSQWAKKEGLYRSEDGGESFTKVLGAQYYGNGSNRPTGFILARDPQKPDVLVTAAARDGVFLSRDNGLTWTASGGTELYPCDIRFDRANSQRLWLCASGGKVFETTFKPGFYRSEDGGATWTKLLDATPSELLQDPRDAAVLYGIFRSAIIKKSTDGGATWVDFSDGLKLKPLADGQWKESIDETGYGALAAGPDFILTCNTRNSTFYKLQSGSDKWEAVTRNAPEVGDWFHKGSWYFGGAAGSITVDPHDANHWFVTDFFAIYQTYDAGRNWRLTIDGMEVTVSHALQQDPTDAGVIHAGLADVGAFTSTDGGTRFRRDSVPDNPETKDDPSGGGNMKCLDLSPKLPARLYGVANRNYYVAWEANQVFISIDRGQTWTRSPMVGLPAKAVCTTIVADLRDPYTAYLTVAGQVKPNGGGVYKSTDGGARWTWMGEGLPKESWFFPYNIWAHGRQLAAGPDGGLIAISKEQGLVYRFDPMARKWAACNLNRGGTLWSVAADRLTAGRYFVAARDDGLYRTNDGGATWKKAYGKSVSYVATDAAVKGRVACGTPDGVILSTDGGETWTELDKALPYRVDNIPAFAGERLFAASLGSGVFWMPLSAAGEKPVAARPLQVAAAPVAAPLPPLQNLSGDAEGETPPGWLTEAPAGTVKLARDAKLTDKGNPASLQITTEGEGAKGSVFQEWQTALWRFKVNGLVRAKGTFTKIEVVVQPYDAQNQPSPKIVLGTYVAGNQWWDGINRTVTLPTATVRARLALNYEGKGQIWLDEVKVSLPAPLFPQ